MTKIALITGASRGIGKTVAIGLAEDGYQTVLIARDAKKLAAVAAEIVQNDGLEPLVIPTDVADETAVKACVEQTVAHFSRIDVLFNNAATSGRGNSSVTSKEFKRQIEINIYGVYYFIHYIVPIMKQQRSGYIINISSKVALASSKVNFTYGTTKAAVRTMSASIFKELLEYNVKVTTLFPSASNTEMNKTPIANEDKIPVTDYINTIRYLLQLSPNTCIAELYLQCQQQIIAEQVKNDSGKKIKNRSNCHRR